MNLQSLLMLIIFSPLVATLILIFLKNSSNVYVHLTTILFSCLTFLFSLELLYFSNSALISSGGNFWQSPATHNVFVYNWLNFGEFALRFKFSINKFAAVLIIFVNFISLLIQIYSTKFLSLTTQDKTNHYRFFALVNFFVSAMNILILADDLILIFLAWELLTLSSYLLIVYYFTNNHTTNASLIAVISNRLGDIFLLIGFCILIALTAESGLVEVYKTILTEATININWLIWGFEYNALSIAGIFILIGIITKAGQLPFQFWLTKAMVAPTPVSALLHSATMVCAGVIILIKLLPILSYTPIVINILIIIASASAIIFAFVGIFQNDIKLILAYSTVSQIGLMLITSSLGFSEIAIYSLINHGVYKVLLFMIAGVLIIRNNHCQDIFKLLPANSTPLLIVYLAVATLSLIGAPFSSSYFAHELLFSQIENSNLIYSVYLTTGLFSTILAFRLLFIVSANKFLIANNRPQHSLSNFSINNLFNEFRQNISLYLPMLILTFACLSFGWLVYALQKNINLFNVAINKTPLININSISLWTSIIGATIAWLLYYQYPNINFTAYLPKCFQYRQNFFRNALNFDFIINLLRNNYKLISNFIFEFFEVYIFTGIINQFKNCSLYFAFFIKKHQSLQTSQYITTMVLALSMAMFFLWIIS